MLDPNEQGVPDRMRLEVRGEDRGEVRGLHFHNTPAWRADEIADGLAGCAPSGRWEVGGPPVAAFFEGTRNHFDVALPLLERAGVRAWFVIPTDFLDVPVAEQVAYAQARDLGLVDDGPRFALTWDELRAIAAAGHHVASHTASHCTLQELQSGRDTQRELAGSRERLENELGVPVRTVCFRYGAAFGDDPALDAAILEAGYETVIAAGRIQTV
jgi:peptidoglycan/xylan/chitin deacetylase (PgdA/CDA1 family)